MKRLNTETQKTFVRNDQRQSDGKIFLRYRKKIDKFGFFYEEWVGPDQYKNLKIKKSEDSKKRNISNRLKVESGDLTKRINPQTGQLFKVGDRNKNGDRFVNYNMGQRSGSHVYEVWKSEDEFKKQMIRRTFSTIRIRSKKEKIIFNLDFRYLLEIFPEDMVCLVLGIKMEWGEEDRRVSPSLDRFIPNLGYVKGNVRFISSISNTIKSDRN